MPFSYKVTHFIQLQFLLLHSVFHVVAFTASFHDAAGEKSRHTTVTFPRLSVPPFCRQDFWPFLLISLIAHTYTMSPFDIEYFDTAVIFS